ncbi:hypothetical protein BRN75_00390 [Xanthomonas oryzae pv. oryzae]|nr:hypothetical protein BRN75_00390 [Xanthomonas oryzae pv. oryzae]
MPPHSEQIVSRICGALFRGSLRLHRAQARSYRSWLREILGGDSDVVHMTLGKPIDPIFVGAGSPAMGHYG